MEIKLTQDQIAIIDIEDFNLVKDYSWYFHKGYARTSFRKNNRKVHIYMHRLINKTLKGFETDHINKNRLDNRKINLRTVTLTQNHWNSERKLGISGFRGIYWEESRSKWMACISSNNKNILIGRFNTRLDAILAYNKRVLELRGNFAILNPIIW